MKALLKPRYVLPRIVTGDVRRPAWELLREGIRREIVEGHWKPGDALMPVRKLCKQLGINRVTADQAIRDLIGEGLLHSERGRGVFVEDISPFRVGVVSKARDDGALPASGYAAMQRAALEVLAAKNVQALVLGQEEGAKSGKFGPPLGPILGADVDAYLPIGIQHEEYLGALVATGRPVVALDAAPLAQSFDGVVLDAFRTGYLATRHLLELGHRRILYVGYDRGRHPGDPLALARIPEPDSERAAAGFVYALKEAGIAREVVKLHEHLPRGEESRDELLRDLSSGRYTAGIMVHAHAEALRAAGALPEGFSVVVTEAARGQAAEWTRVEADEAEFGVRGAQRMLQRLPETRKPRLPGPRGDGAVFTIAPRLAAAASTRRIGPPPALYSWLERPAKPLAREARA
ncbi:MAG: GntR family transcriptional regulator [Planctomycetota bacterium]|nr:GntR family transcriptional regulator [Planctomycetota bacterium]